MRELRQKQIIKHRLYSLPSLLIFGLITVFLISGAYRVLNKGIESKAKIDLLSEKKDNLLQRQDELKNSIQTIQTDEGIDKEIKEKFSVSKEGEKVVVIVDPKPIATSTEEKVIPWYKKLWEGIIGD